MRSRTWETGVISPGFEDEVCARALSSVQEAAKRANVWPQTSAQTTQKLVLWLVRGITTYKAFIAFDLVCHGKFDLFSYTELTCLCCKAVRTWYATVVASLKLWLENLQGHTRPQCSPSLWFPSIGSAAGFQESYYISNIICHVKHLVHFVIVPQRQIWKVKYIQKAWLL